jgi:archaellum component FlaF (FlaF/FlaG flagellin family)
MFAHRRGLASVVTSAILLSSVAILGVGLVGWSNSNLLSHQQNLENTFTQNINKLNEYVTFEKVWFGGISPNKFVNVTVTNTGNVGLNVTSIQFVNSTTLNEINLSAITDGGLINSQSYSTEINYEWINDAEFDILLKSYRDSQFRTQVSP